ncbi:penicillin-binding protein 1A [Pseudoalteromonas denitrificans]|uniref:Penicillin-binding protein 1A n=1 Tax=Pseudoalteromonas denitrificans DSM 6059 TaxID=1123010 RepID=A0A1I1JYJ7_9GAMM|nr:PBP1A family penicillin-binding protein [Pseudoalteromonas denitrificans]SFC53321.1 penicillin-binding protein 1A [Pseudoalteromonas denitrificans DSM 6059]
MTLLKNILRFIIISTVIGLLTLLGLYYYVKSDIPSVDILKDVQLQTPMLVYTKDGKLINQFGEKRRIPVKIDEIPQTLINAFLATEDSRFYEHFGIDPIGIIRSAIVLITTGQKKQGASTITMQLARNFFLTREKAYIRKVKEIFIAMHIESLLSKDEILALYLNKIELGNRAFGIGAAAQVYYGKSLNELSLPEMAMLAGLPKAPSALNPIRNPKRAKSRRNIVLGRLLSENHITESQYENAIKQPITARFHGAEIEISAPYISEMVRAEMVKRYGLENAYNNGYRVYTSITSGLQLAAQYAVTNNLQQYDLRHGYRGPKLYLWNSDEEEQWHPTDILKHLKSIKEVANLKAGVVTAVFETSIQVLLKDGHFVTVQWDGLKWARPYINDNRQGKPPKTAIDILNTGAQIWLLEQDQSQYTLSQIPDASGALVSLNPQNGAILAIIGGYSFKLSQYNRAVQAKRQVGSNIKPFIYSAAINNNYTLASIMNDAAIHQWDKSQGIAWRPKNSPEKYVGPIRVRRALAQSKNVISVRLLRGVGLNKTADYLLNFGFKAQDIHRNETLALGSASLTPLELATGMATFANGGHLIEPYFISKIDDAFGNELFKAKPLIACLTCNEQEIKDTVEYAPRVISKQNAFLIANAMTSTIWGGGNWTHKTGWNGTGWRAQKLKRRDLSGKTGTTNNQVDTWFTGFNRNILTTTWVGFDNPGKSLGKTKSNSNLGKNQVSGTEAGARTAQPAWVDFMQYALKEQPIAPIEQPEGLVSVRIDLKTGLLSHKTDYTSRFEYFIKNTAPTQYIQDSEPAIFEDNNEGKVVEEEELF